MKKKNKTKNRKLIDAYQLLLERAKSRLDEFEHITVPEALEHAKERAIELEEITVDEAENLVMFVQRDLHDAAHHLHDTGENLKFWLNFDVTYIEEKLWNTFSQIADKTVVDKLLFDYRIQRGPIYKTGEITGLGTLQCETCGQLLHFHKVSHIPPCGKCHGETFSRIKREIRH